MRVALISSSFFPAVCYGGPIYATLELSEKLSNNGFEVYVSTTNANGDFQLDVNTDVFLRKAENFYVKYYNEQIKNKFSFNFIFGVWSDIKLADVVYIQYIFHYTVFFAVFFSFLLSKRVIISPRGSLSKWGLNYKHKFKKFLWLNYFIRPLVKDVTWQASSYLEKDDICRVFTNSKVEVITDGIDFDSFQNTEELSKLDLVNLFTYGNFSFVSEVFFSMGRIHEIKGFDILIDAFNLFVRDSPHAKLIIAGSNDGFEMALKKQIISNNLSDSVFLIGQVDHKQKCLLLRNATAFVLASRFESFGIVIAEALASGIPVIVSNKTPWIDIERNNCGIFTDNNKSSFYKALCFLKNNKFDSRVIKSYVNDNFDWNVILRKFISLLKFKN